MNADMDTNWHSYTLLMIQQMMYDQSYSNPALRHVWCFCYLTVIGRGIAFDTRIFSVPKCIGIANRNCREGEFLLIGNL